MERGTTGPGGWRDDDGSSTVEFVLWMPVFVFVLCVVVDVCFVMFAQSFGYEVAANAARKWAVEDMTAAEVRTFVTDHATFNGAAPDVSQIVDPGGSDIRTVTFTWDLDQVDVTGVLGFVASQKITSSVTRIAE